MKFRFKNLGPIQEADLELGDLTIIAGRNNTGKTYLAYALYGFLKRWQWPSASVSDLLRQEGMERHLGSSAFAAFHRGYTMSAVDRRELDKRRSDVARAMARAFSQSELAQVFSSERGRFEGASVELRSGLPEDVLPAHLRDSSGVNYRIHWEDDQITISVDAPQGQRVKKGPAIFALEMLYYRFLFPELEIEPFVLSSERFGISLFYRELDFTKNNLVDLLQRMRDESNPDQSDPFLLIDQDDQPICLAREGQHRLHAKYPGPPRRKE